MTDFSHQRWTEALVAAQRRIFEILARGEPDDLGQALRTVVLAIEGIIEGVLGSVLLLDADGKRLWVGAGPTLPASYNQAIHGALIGPEEGSCGTAAYRKQQVITPDIANDPRWINYRELAASHGLRACWSTPILDRRGEVLGTFAMYFREVRSPTGEELQLVADATAAAALAIQHVRTRESLARTVGQLEATLESTADGILVVDRDGTIQRYNQRVLQMWGIPERVMETRDMKQVQAVTLHLLRDPAAVLRRYEEIRRHPEVPALDVLELKDGREFERYHQVQRIGAEVTGDAWSFRDVTEQKRAEKALRESEQRFRTLAEASVEGVVLHDDGVILLANEGLARMYGYEVAELIGMRVEQLAAPVSRDAVLSSIHSGKDQRYEAIGTRRDGSQFWGEVRSRVAEFEGRQVRVVVVRDVSDRKNLEEARERNLAQERQARVAAERAVRQYDDFLEIASHELKTPLTPLKMYLQLLRHTLRAVALPPSRQTTLLLEALDNTDHEYERLLGLIDDLLDVSRLTAGRLVLTREPADLSRITTNVIARLEPELVRTKSSLQLTVQPGATGSWDRARVEQIVTNLLLNALKYGAGRPVEIRVEPANGMAVLTVRDQGIGIAPEEQARVFDRFSRGVSINNYGGLGLGLFIARQLVLAQGGTISVESELGKGACFSVRLPLGEAAVADVRPQQAPESHPAP